MQIALGSDHAGYPLKELLKRHLAARGLDFIDLGCFSEDPADYPVYAAKTARAVANETAARGIICCGTGIGVSIAANKVAGIRAACCGDEFAAEMARKHNDVNVLCLGARVTQADAALRIADVFLDTEASVDERHHARVRMITDIERGVL